MADQIEINIYLKGNEQAATNGATDSAGTGGNIEGLSQSGNTQNGTTQSSGTNMKALGKYISSQTIDVFLNNAKSVISQNIGIITGKTELQQRVNFAMSTIQQGVNTYKNAQAGAVMFSSMGMSGGAGFAIGAALSVISYGINMSFRQAQLDLKEGLENRQIQQTRTRAGAGFNKSREGR